MSFNTSTTPITGGQQAAWPDGQKVLGATLAVTAAGSTQADAAALAYGTTKVAGADSTAGVRLPAAVDGAMVAVSNPTAAQTLDIYPASGETINNGTVNVALTAAAQTLTILLADADGNWGAL